MSLLASYAGLFALGYYPLTVGKYMLYAGNYEIRYSVRGQPFYVWKKPMPRIDDGLLDCVVYLYPSKEAADAGEAAGGTGFLVSVSLGAHEHFRVTYCVTNSHVIREGSSPVVRLNTTDGGRDIIELNQEDWTHHQDGDDLAVCPLAIGDPSYYQYSQIHTSNFVTKEFVEQQSLGPGDEVFVIGRFVNHEGRQRNTPVVRFGNISMMPWEPVPHPRGITQESFLVEMRSLSGFSGSPVFVYQTPTTPYPAGLPERTLGTWLLGVDWGHPPVYEKIRYKDDGMPVDENWVVKSNSGQMAVAPAWKLQELLDQEVLVMQRKSIEDEITKKKASSPVVLDVLPQGARQTAQEGLRRDAFTEDDFEDALDRVSRPVSPPDPES